MNIKEYECKLLNEIVQAIIKEDYKKRIVSIIITGSFGRKEQTYLKDKEKTILKSDIEVGLVYKSFCRKYIKRIAWKVNDMFEEDLNLMDMSYYRVKSKCNYNNCIIPTRKKTIFTYDLYNGSYTIWGDKIIEKRNVDKKGIDLYEAKRIVANRIAEYNYLKENNDLLEKQWSGKILLAIGSAWLILSDCYKSSYHDQQREINKKTKEISKELGKNFLEDYNKVFGYLRDNLDECVIPKERLLLYVSRIDEIIKKMKINKSKVNTTTRKLKYVSKYIMNCNNSFFAIKELFNIEDYILSNVIKSFVNGKQEDEIASFWHKVIY